MYLMSLVCGPLQLEQRRAAETEAEAKAQEAKREREAQSEATDARTRQAEAAFAELQTALQGVQVCRRPLGLLDLHYSQLHWPWICQ